MSKFFKVNVSAVIFNDKSQVLIQKRSEQEEVYPGLWGIPGGTVEMKDSSLAEALQREVEEEVGIKIENIKLEKENIRNKEMYGVAYLVFRANIKSGIPRPCEDTEEVKWINEKDLERYEFTPTTREIIKDIYERRNPNNSI